MAFIRLFQNNTSVRRLFAYWTVIFHYRNPWQTEPILSIRSVLYSVAFAACRSPSSDLLNPILFRPGLQPVSHPNKV